MTYLAQLHGLKEICVIGVLVAADGKRNFVISSQYGDAGKGIELVSGACSAH